MLTRYSDWKKPTDADYAFQLRALAPSLPSPGVRSDIRQVAREVLGDEAAERFERKVYRWSGPEDVVGEAGEKPYEGPQLFFEEHAWRETLTRGELDAVLQGNVLVLRGPSGQADYVMRDHHMLDVALYHYRTTGELPRTLFHADRHSDWCKDSFLEARVPPQAATWWKLLEGLKRPDDAAPVLTEQDVFFTTAQAEHRPWMTGRNVDAAIRVPWFVDTTELHWRQVLERPGATRTDWLSLDLDYFQPSPQLRLSGGLLRDSRFHTLMAEARVRVFVLSPQFTNGGDKIDPWEIQGSLPSSLRLLNLLRQLPGKPHLVGSPSSTTRAPSP